MQARTLALQSITTSAYGDCDNCDPCHRFYLCSLVAFVLYSSTSQTTTKGNHQMPTIPITVAHGDGIGPEIMEATLHILKEAGAKLAIEKIEIGEKVYLSGNTSGIDSSAWDSLRSTRVFLKAPITTPQGGGYKSLNEIAAEYPDIENEHWIVDIGAAKMADTPDVFDVIVMPNLYGDILSDVAAQIAGSVGLAGSANIGENVAMFEAIHGSAPRRAGQNLANPSGLLLGAIMMLVHIGQSGAAEKVHNAWLRTIEDGVHTYDIFDESVSKQKVGTKEFAQAVVERLGKKPHTLKPVTYKEEDVAEVYSETIVKERSDTKKELVGVDVFLDWLKGSPDNLGAALTKMTGDGLKLVMISNRGVKVWPGGKSETFCSDHWRCRFMSQTEGATITHQQLIDLPGQVAAGGFDFIKTENLCNFDGERGYSLDQGE